MDSLIYQEAPVVHLASNTFVGVPTVLQYDDTPLIQIVRAAEAGFTTEIPTYHHGLHLPADENWRVGEKRWKRGFRCCVAAQITKRCCQPLDGHEKLQR